MQRGEEVSTRIGSERIVKTENSTTKCWTKIGFKQVCLHHAPREASHFKGSRNSAKISKLIFSYKSMAGSSQYRFGVLAKIVKHMKTRHLDGDDHPLTIEDILDETNQLDIGSSVKNV